MEKLGYGGMVCSVYCVLTIPKAPWAARLDKELSPSFQWGAVFQRQGQQCLRKDTWRWPPVSTWVCVHVCLPILGHTHTHRFRIQVIVLAKLTGSSSEVGSGPAGLYNINTTSKHPGSDSFLFARTGFYSVMQAPSGSLGVNGILEYMTDASSWWTSMQAGTRCVLSREGGEGKQVCSNYEKLFGIRLIGLMQKADLSKFMSTTTLSFPI